MRHFRLPLFSFLFALLIFAACSSDGDNPVDANDGNGDGTGEIFNPTGQPLPEGEDFENAAGMLATINYAQSPGFGLPDVDINMGFASFADGADAGNISVNNQALGKQTQEDMTFYSAPSASNPNPLNVSFDGSAHNWSVSGAGDIPSFSGSVSSASTFSITSPAKGATINTSNGMTVEWSGSGSGDNVMVTVVPLDANEESGGYTSGILNDTGSHTISASAVGAISGQAQVFVLKFNWAVSQAGGKAFVMVSEVVRNHDFTANN